MAPGDRGIAGDERFDRVGVRPTPDPGERLSPGPVWDESARPGWDAAPPGGPYSARGRAVARHLVDVHDHLRSELAQIRDLIDQVRAGALDAARARSAINELTLRQNNWALGAYCASYCRLVAGHHMLEDDAIFPHLRAREAGLAPVLDRLAHEHAIIHGALESFDRALVDLLRRGADFSAAQQAADTLTDALLSHLAYEEAQLIEPLARHGFYPGQI